VNRPAAAPTDKVDNGWAWSWLIFDRESEGRAVDVNAGVHDS